MQRNIIWILLMIGLKVVFSEYTPTCEHPIYCKGDLLKTIQLANIFEDSKTFVDLKMKYAEEKITKDFKKLMVETDSNPLNEELENFIQNNFESGNELQEWTPPDFHSTPPFLDEITIPEYRIFAKELVQIWRNLSRIMKPEVLAESNKYSIIPVPNGFIIPGGRFKELYYWDTYWIIKGLLISNMHETAKGMLDNLLSMVQRFGFVPNGSRMYYLNRSQPPLLNLMVLEYIRATNDINWLKNTIDLLKQELEFWLKNRTTTFNYNNKNYILALYSVDDASPRPESYKEDVSTCSAQNASDENEKCYRDLKSGAESGWDFSSRWFSPIEECPSRNLSCIDTGRVLPVDLNSYLTISFGLVASFATMTGDNSAESWLSLYKIWKESINEVFFDEEDGIWYDFDIKLMKPRKAFYPSNFAPLWSGLTDDPVYGDRAIKYLEKTGVLDFPGGVPTSLLNTGEQWDAPNAWPPLQSLVVMGLKRSGSEKASEVAEKMAKKWIDNNFLTFDRTEAMFEKYKANTVGVEGGGGEYNVQTGFGWTNGEVLELIQEFFTGNNI